MKMQEEFADYVEKYHRFIFLIRDPTTPRVFYDLGELKDGKNFINLSPALTVDHFTNFIAVLCKQEEVETLKKIIGEYYEHPTMCVSLKHDLTELWIRGVNKAILKVKENSEKPEKQEDLVHIQKAQKKFEAVKEWLERMHTKEEFDLLLRLTRYIEAFVTIIEAKMALVENSNEQ